MFASPRVTSSLSRCGAVCKYIDSSEFFDYITTRDYCPKSRWCRAEIYGWYCFFLCLHRE